MIMSGKEFPNNWEEIVHAPDEAFETCTYAEFMDGMACWMLPSSHAVILRVTNKDTGKVKEHAYQKMGAARNKLMKLVEDPANEVIICDNESIHLIKRNESDHA